MALNEHRCGEDKRADLETAKRLEGRAFADLPDAIQSVGGELVPAESDHRHGGSMRNTVAYPSYITADASKSRLDLAFDAGVLETGLDAAETIEARNSLEKMMAHQMAAQHSSIMKLFGAAQSLHRTHGSGTAQR